MKTILFIAFTCVFSFMMGLPSLGSTIAAGRLHTLIVDEYGQVWAMGSNYSGQLGLGDRAESNVPVKIEGVLPFITAVASAYDHSLLLDVEGQVWAMGSNYAGQLGLGDTDKRNVPVKIEANLPFITAVAAGVRHSLFLDIEGHVWAIGSNSSGQLGLGDRAESNVPVKIEGDLPRIIAVAAGNYHSLLLDVEGQVWAMGANYSGQLGLGDTDKRNVPVKIEANLPRIIAVAAGDNYSLFIDHEGQVWAMGGNSSGQLGLGDRYNRNVPVKIEAATFPRITAVAAASCHSIFVDEAGNLLSCGGNRDGQLGNGNRLVANDIVYPKLGDSLVMLPRNKRGSKTKSARNVAPLEVEETEVPQPATTIALEDPKSEESIEAPTDPSSGSAPHTPFKLSKANKEGKYKENRPYRSKTLKRKLSTK